MSSNSIMNKRLWSLRKSAQVPLYLQIQDLILEHIQTGRAQPGDLLPSYPWLSKTLGVADKTVRQAYSNLQQMGVLTIQRGKGTFVAKASPARQAASGERAGVIGILPPLLASAEEPPHFWEVLRAFQQAAFAERLDALLLARPADLRSAGFAERIADRARVDAVVVLAPAEAEFLRRLQALQVSLVLAGQEAPEGTEADAVVFDYAGAAREWVYRLIGLGHRRIGLLRGARDPAADLAEAGYRHAMGSVEQAVRPEWIGNAEVALGETGLSAADVLLDQDLSAVVACGLPLAEAVWASAQRRGKTLPKDLSLAALGVGAAEHLPALPGGPALEAALFEPAQMAQRALRRLEDLREGRDLAPRREALEAARVEGGTVGQAP